MKSIRIWFAILFSTILFTSFSATRAQNYQIEVSVDHMTDSVAYLGYYYGDKRFLKDTSSVINQKVTFQGAEELPGGIYFIYTDPNHHYFEILIDKDQQFKIATDTSDFVKNMQVDGSVENDLFRDLRVFVSGKQKKAAELNQQLQAEENEDNKEKLRSQIQEIEKEVIGYQNQIVAEHPRSFVATIIRATQKPEIPPAPEGADRSYQYNYYKNHFFDQLDLSDDRLLRTNFLHGKINEYMENLTVQHPDSISKSAQYIINQARDNQDMFRYLVVTLTSKYETSEIMGMDAVFVDLAEKYYLSGQADWADSTVINKIKTKVEETKPNLIGKKAPNMVLYDSLKRPVNLHSLNSKYTILFFFDPDCGHCKKVTPKLKEIYPSIKEKGAEVIAISTVPEVDPFVDYVQEFDLNWINLIDFRYQRKSYNIVSTPVVYILDQDKTIIAKRLDVNQIEGFLDHQESVSKGSLN